MSKPTIKDTKATIFEAYKDVVAKLKDKNSTAMNVEDIKTKKVNTEVLEKASKFVMDENSLSTLEKSMKSFSERMLKELEEYTNIQSAINLKKSELQELFGIEKEAFTLAALVDSHDAIKDDFNSEMDDRKRSLNEQLQKVVDTIDEQKRLNKIERDREQEAYDYGFERDKQERVNALNDQLNAMKKDHLNKIEVLNEDMSKRTKDMDEREEAISNHEEDVVKLQQKVDEIPTEIAAAVKAKVGKAEGMLKSKYDTEMKFTVAAHETQVATINAKNEEMEKMIDSLNKTVLSLGTKLETAYGEIKEMAVKTVEGAGNNKALSDLTAALGKKNS